MSATADSVRERTIGEWHGGEQDMQGRSTHGRSTGIDRRMRARRARIVGGVYAAWALEQARAQALRPTGERDLLQMNRRALTDDALPDQL